MDPASHYLCYLYGGYICCDGLERQADNPMDGEEKEQ